MSGAGNFPADVKEVARAVWRKALKDGTPDAANIIAAAIMAERERCAHVADVHGLEHPDADHCQGCGEIIAAAILAGA